MDFLRFLKDDVQVCLKVAEQLSEKYLHCDEVRSLGLSGSTGRGSTLVILDPAAWRELARKLARIEEAPSARHLILSL